MTWVVLGLLFVLSPALHQSWRLSCAWEKCRVVQPCWEGSLPLTQPLWCVDLRTRSLGHCFVSDTMVLRDVVLGRPLCSCTSFAGYLHASCSFGGKDAVNGFVPTPAPWIRSVLFFSLAHPTDKHHFLVSYTDSIARFGQDPVKEKKWQRLWGGLGSGPWPLVPPALVQRYEGCQPIPRVSAELKSMAIFTVLIWSSAG